MENSIQFKIIKIKSRICNCLLLFNTNVVISADGNLLQVIHWVGMRTSYRPMSEDHNCQFQIESQIKQWIWGSVTPLLLGHRMVRVNSCLLPPGGRGKSRSYCRFNKRHKPNFPGQRASLFFLQLYWKDIKWNLLPTPPQKKSLNHESEAFFQQLS